ncbi:Uncharacterised protein [Pantoea agglomerans]|uniref:Uncharacterized protein n=1 Tax=Enterobacter agglomerans TaxID=549 RepID=A0A379AM93_ENTAG|nr:Uncharacterised protein [Pantoea agglomerans]
MVRILNNVSAGCTYYCLQLITSQNNNTHKHLNILSLLLQKIPKVLFKTLFIKGSQELSARQPFLGKLNKHIPRLK